MVLMLSFVALIVEARGEYLLCRLCNVEQECTLMRWHISLFFNIV
jgi:hypothetical protein